MTTRARIVMAALTMLIARGAHGADGSANVLPAADLVVTQRPVIGTTSLNFLDWVTVRNMGPSAAESGMLRFLASDGVTITGATLDVGVRCTADGFGAMTCTLGTLAPNAEITIAVNLRARAAGTYSVTVSTSSTTADPDLANNRDEQSFQVTDGAGDGGAGDGGAGGTAGTGGSGSGCDCAATGPAGVAAWSQLSFALVAAILIARRRR